MSTDEEINVHNRLSLNSIRKEKEKCFILKDMKRETMSQTYQYVNRLVKEKQYDDFEGISQLVSSNEPLSLFEESLRLIIVDSLKIEDEVVKVLLSQNNHQIKRILRCDWFFQNTLSPGDYCTKIFPHVSVSLRYKIINRLSKNLKQEKDAEELFNFICSDYSYQHAEILFPKCSSQFILDFFEKKKPLFMSERSGTILLKITQRYPNVGLHILDAIFVTNESNHALYCFKNVCLCLAHNHPHIFIPFFKKHHLKMKFLNFGRKLSQKLGLELKDFLIQSPNLGIFKEQSLFQVLSFEDQAKYLASRVKFVSETLSLENWARATDNLVSLLKLLPPDQVLPCIQLAFKQVYHLNFSDCPKAWKLEILEVIPLAGRVPYVKSLKKFLIFDNSDLDRENPILDEFLVSEINEEPQKLICLEEFSVAFDEFKKILRKAPTLNERERILRYAVHNCVINKDAKGLEQLIEYVRTRLRNDNHKFIFKILEEMIESFPKSALTLNTVQKLEEICYLGVIRGDYYHYSLIMEDCIQRRMEEGMDVKAQVKNVIDLALARQDFRSVIWNIRSKYSRILFHEYYREIFRWIEENSSNTETKRCLIESLLETLRIFNSFHKKNPILLRDLPELSAELEVIVKKYHVDVSFDFDWIGLWEKFNSVANYESKWSRSSFFRYTLKRNPEAVIGNMEPLWKHLCENYPLGGKKLFLDLKKIFSFLGQTDKVKETLLDRFKTGYCTTVKLNALKMYAGVCDVEEFEKAIQDYLPKEGTLNVEEEASVLEIQLMIPRLIKDVKPDCKNLPLISKFLKRDFLKNVSSSFMSYCYHTRIDILVPNLFELLNEIPEYGRTAYEKTVVRLVAEVVNRRQKLEFCAKRWEESSHYSIRTVLFRFISNSFLEDPTQMSFVILANCIFESDNVIIQSRPDMNRVPKEFVHKYMAVLWKYSENQTAVFRKSFMNSILQFFSSRNIGWLSEELSEDIIRSNLFRRSGIEVNNFAVYYLISDSEKMEPRMNIILDLLKNLAVDETTVSSFLRTLKTIWLEGSLVPIFDTLLKHWPDSVPLTFDERLSLTYFSLYEKSAGNVHQDKSGDVVSSHFGERLKAFYLSFGDSNDFVLIFVESLRHFFDVLDGCKKTLNIVLVALVLLAHPSPRSLAIVTTLILPDTLVEFYKRKEFDFTKHSSEEDFINVINLLEANQDEVVQIYFRRKFGFKKFKSNVKSVRC